MRDAYLSFVDWEEMDAQISELEKVTKEDVVRDESILRQGLCSGIPHRRAT